MPGAWRNWSRVYFTYQCQSDKGWWPSTPPRCLSWDAGRWQTPAAGEAFLPAPAGSGRESKRHLKDVCDRWLGDWDFFDSTHGVWHSGNLTNVTVAHSLFSLRTLGCKYRRFLHQKCHEIYGQNISIQYDEGVQMTTSYGTSGCLQCLNMSCKCFFKKNIADNSN